MAELSWVILTIGHLSMNRFWGETERKRSALCTITLIRTSEGLLLVDPSVLPQTMPTLLNDAAGVRTEDVRHVYLTHFHGDHRYGLEAFPEAQWWMATPETEFWNQSAGPEEKSLLKRLCPAEEMTVPGLSLLPTPGHTPGLTSLTFTWRGQRVAIAADAAMTEEFFWAREGYHNSTDFEAARASIDLLAQKADLVIPGHGNAFRTELRPEEGGMWSGGPIQPGPIQR